MSGDVVWFEELLDGELSAVLAGFVPVRMKLGGMVCLMLSEYANVEGVAKLPGEICCQLPCASYRVGSFVVGSDPRYLLSLDDLQWR